jgi:hypothetical protein
MSFSFHVESDFVWGSSWIGGDFWWLRVQVSWRRHSPNCLVLVQQETEGLMKYESASVKACVFDTFGTVVDWPSSVIAEATNWGRVKGLDINWVEFTDRWRLGYGPAMDKVRRGEIPWTNLDDLNRMILEDLLKQYKIDGLSKEEKANWAHVWRRLKPWPDSVEGLGRLKKNTSFHRCRTAMSR